MKKIYLVITIIVIALVSVGFYVSLQEVNRYLDLKAIHDCSLDYHTEIPGKTATQEATFRPMEQQVRECAWQKGVKSWNGVWSDLLQNQK